MFVLDPSIEKPISVQISNGGGANRDTSKMNKSSKLSQGGKPGQKSNNGDTTHSNAADGGPYEKESIHKRVDSLFENAEKAMRVTNTNSKLKNQLDQISAVKQDMNIKVNNS